MIILLALRQIQKALGTKYWPNILNVYKILTDFPMLVYRLEKDLWEGPYFFKNISRESLTILVPKKSTKFLSTVVKKHCTESMETSNGSLTIVQPGNTLERNSPQTKHICNSKFENYGTHMKLFELSALRSRAHSR